MIERTLPIIGRLGLHARAAARLVRVANGFDSQIRLRRVDGVGDPSLSADAKSILSVLMLAATHGTQVAVSTDGVDEEDAMSAVAQLFADGFGEVEPKSSL